MEMEGAVEGSHGKNSSQGLVLHNQSGVNLVISITWTWRLHEL